MRILFQIFNSDGGGFSNVVLLLRSMIKSYREDRLLFVASDRTDVSGLKDAGGIEVRLIPVRSFVELERARLLFNGVGSLARSWGADVVWSFNLGPFRRQGIPQVVSLHNAFEVVPWSLARTHPLGLVHSVFLRAAFRRGLGCSDGVIVQTQDMRSLVRKIRGCPSRIAVIPKAVETDADLAAGPIPAPVAARVLPDGRWFTYLYVASWFSHKNHEVLFSALEQLRRSNVPIRLVVSIEPELLHSETAEVRRLVLEGRIVPVGWVAKEWLRALYNAADGCLMPSLIESLSSSHLEAMQWGKPQIVSDLPYAHALCGDAAIYASPEDPTAWSGEMLRLREDVALRERLVAAGRRRMEMMPNSWTQVAMKARSFLEEVSRSGRPRDMAACGREL